jgi:WD40 repeat protein
MTSGTQRKPASETGTGNDEGATGLRDMIQQAISAYELAVTTQTRIATQAARHRKQRLADLDAQEAASTEQREESLRAQQAAAEAEAERVKTLSALAAELTESASGLLERAALAHIRGFGPASTEIAPHAATDEQAASAFAAAQLANVNVRTVILRLAQEYLGVGDWPRARELAATLTGGPAGTLAAEAAAVDHAAFLEEVREALSRGDAESAHAKAEAWLRTHPQDAEMSSLQDQAVAALRTACLTEVREALSSGDSESARAKAEAWLQVHKEDAEMSGLLLDAAASLAEQAAESGDHLRAALVITVAEQRHGTGHPQLREVMRRHPAAAWRAGRAQLLYEFGGHSQPVRALAYTADGQHLVSADDIEVKTWNIAASASGRLERTVSVAGTRALRPDGMQAVTSSGTFRLTEDGGQTGDIGAIAAQAFSSDSWLHAWAARTVHWQCSVNSDSELERRLNTSGLQALEINRQMRSFPNPPPEESLVKAAKVEGAGSYNGYQLSVKFISSLKVANVMGEQPMRTIVLDLSHAFIDIALSGSARKVAALTPDGEVVVSDIDSGTRTHKFSVGHARSIVNSIAFSPDGELLLVANGGYGTVTAGQSNICTELTIWEISTGRTYWSWSVTGRIGAVAFSPDSRLLAALALEGRVSMFDVHARQALHDIGDYGLVPYLPCLAFSPDGSRLAVGGGREVKVWGL